MKDGLGDKKPELDKLRSEIPELVRQGGMVAEPIEEKFNVLLQNVDESGLSLDDLDKKIDDEINKAEKFNDACDKLKNWLPEACKSPCLTGSLSSDPDDILKQIQELNVRPQLIFTYSKSTMETLEKDVEICSKLTIKTPERRQCRSAVFIVNFEHISHLFTVFLMLTFNK